MNTLQVLQPQEELTDLQIAIMEESALEEFAFDFVPQRFKMPTGGNVFFTLDDEPVKEFTAIVALSQKARAFWPTKDQLGLPPFCSSPDGQNGWAAQSPPMEQLQAADKHPFRHPVLPVIQETDERGPYNCARCPLSAFGSDPKNKRGQACKSLRRLVMLVDGHTMPILLTLPPTSVKGWDRFCTGLQSRKSAYFAVRTQFKLEKQTNADGVEFGVVVASVAGKIETQEQFAAVQEIRRQYRDLITTLPIDSVEYEVVGEAEEMPPF